MKQFNGTDYDTLYPKTIASQIPDVYSKTEVLTTKTLSKYGLTADKLPNDVFQQIKTLIDNVQSSTDSKAKIQTGSYVGTGTYGANNPCSLTFDFEPTIVMILSASANNSTSSYVSIPSDTIPGERFSGKNYWIVDFKKMPTDYSNYAGFGGNRDKFSEPYGKRNGNTLYWYASILSGWQGNSQSSWQFNNSAWRYNYIAIG